MITPVSQATRPLMRKDPPSRQVVSMMEFVFETGRPTRIAGSEWVIFKTQDEYMGISRLKTLKTRISLIKLPQYNDWTILPMNYHKL